MRHYVAEIQNNVIQSIALFPETEKGDQKARVHFKDLCEENEVTEHIVSLGDGSAQAECGDWTIQLGRCSAELVEA